MISLQDIREWTLKSRFFKTIFTPFFLIYTTIVVIFASLYLSFGQAIKNNSELYAYVLVFIAVLIFLRSFVITFSNLRLHLQKHRGFAIGFDTLLFVGVIYLASLSFYYSKITSYPLAFFVLFAMSSAIFYIQLFLSQSQPLLKTTFFNFVFYVLATILFYFLTRTTDFGINLDVKIRSIITNLFTFTGGVFEVFVFFQAMKHFFKDKLDS